MKNQSITEAMLQFIEESPTAFHAAANVEALLLENGFEKLENLAEGALVPGGSYYTMQNGSAVLAVKIPENPAKGFRIAASHSDSPSLKIKENPGVKIYNLGTGKGYSVLDVIHAFGKACGKEIPYEIKPRRAGDIATCYSDASLAKKELGWEAQYDIDEMCADSWKWQSMNPDGYNTPEK